MPHDQNAERVSMNESELPESRLYTFIDEAREFALYFLEGQRLIHDLALLHEIGGAGFAYFRDAVLSVQPMIALIKRGEQIGFYLDSTEPHFRLKIEAAHRGDMRCALVPEDFREFPERMWGIARVQKIFPDGRAPYTSLLRVDGLSLGAVVNQVLATSYQVNSVVLISQRTDQSAMLHQLPTIERRGEYQVSAGALRERESRLQGEIDLIFARALHRSEEVEAAFAEIGFRRLADRPVRFRCGCSSERIVTALLGLSEDDRADLFDAGSNDIEIKCEYCKSRYRVTRDDLARPGEPVN